MLTTPIVFTRRPPAVFAPVSATVFRLRARAGVRARGPVVAIGATILAAVLTLGSFTTPAAAGPLAGSAGSEVRPREPLDAGQLQLAVRKLRVLGSALYIAAHPDDENTAFLSYLSSGRLVRAGYL